MGGLVAQIHGPT